MNELKPYSDAEKSALGLLAHIAIMGPTDEFGSAEAKTIIAICARLEAASKARATTEVEVAIDQGRVLPKLENCGHYLAEDNTGQWHYINHANTWQAYPGPTTAEARAIAYASPSRAATEVDCPDCGRHVMANPQPATGWIAMCGRRLTRIDECSDEGCATRIRTALAGGE